MKSVDFPCPLSFPPGDPHHAASIPGQIEETVVTSTINWLRTLPFIGLAAALVACSTAPQITRTQDLDESADAPYQKVLVIVLLSAFDSRRYLEDEIVVQLSERGTDAVASTSMMNTKTPVTRQTFLAMVEEIGADAVIITQLVSLRSEGELVDMNPQATYNFRPTYYYNVWSVDLEEYVEPQAAKFEHSLVLATQVYSVLKHEAVWAIESKSEISQGFDEIKGYSVVLAEAKAIGDHLSRDGLIAR